MSFVVIKDGGQGEVEIELPDRYSRLAARRLGDAGGAGVVEVELV